MSEICLDVDLHSVCRICLSQTEMNEHLFNIFSDAIVDGVLVSLPHVIEYCVDIQVKAEPGLPNKVCQKCKAKLFKFYVFKQKCHRTDSVLRSLLEKLMYSVSGAIENEEEQSTKLQQYEDGSKVSSDLLCSAESVLQESKLVESLQDEIHSDCHTETSLEYDSPLDETFISIGQDDTSNVSASIEAEYIEETYEELASTSSAVNATIDDHQSGALMHVTITQISPNANECFTCEICGCILASKARLRRHMKLHADSDAVSSQMHFYPCTGCKALFLSEKTLNEHRQVCSKVISNLSEQYPQDITEQCYDRCGICGVYYPNIVQLKQHIITHMENFPCPFDGCGCEYVSLARLNIHVSTKHVDYFSSTCPHCKKDIDRVDLVQHLRTSCQEKHFDCSHCDKKFFSSRALSQHLKKLDQLFHCIQCDRSFSSRAAYSLHVRTHTGERPFVCKLCNKAFKSASQRTAHMDTHIEGKTFECSICGKCLQTRASYRNHIKRHLEERTHGCDECSKKFYAKHSLRKHQEKVHKNKRGSDSHQVDDL
ncbi:oocyte zinc finger protein XlCOF6-like [Anopheles ziemanni]|uniref:oocyte zinc finger protein XlCOF6-like n=1 Tax=Anopheles coustani TaxID=139045 RepID=UPI002658BFAB|nr:oocyte zinc finger protein XlCOF6-like [Anopheles coustani]XP_058170110.1 oocyte zinc finger protein XlCOF6-like [Anopheles ziemanni]